MMNILGQFYGEFIRYSGGDGQSLGVVLTPPHITELSVICWILNHQMLFLILVVVLGLFY